MASEPDRQMAMNVHVPEPMLPRPYRVQRVRQETPDTFTLELEPANGAGPDGNGAGELGFSAGQFNMLYVFGLGEVPISISGDPARPKMLVHTARAVGAVTKGMRKLKRGHVLGVRGPFGSHWPLEEARGATS